MRYLPSGFLVTRLSSRPSPACRGRWPPAAGALGPARGRPRGGGGGFPSWSDREGTFDSLRRGLHYLEALDVPRVEPEHRPTEPARQRDLAQGPPPRADRDHAVSRGDDHQVAGLAEAGRNRDA